MNRIRAFCAVAVVLGFVLAGCGSNGEDTAKTSTSESTTTATAATATTTSTTGVTAAPTTAPSGVTVQVFFSAGDGSDCSQVAALDRTIADGADPFRATFDQLVAGPTTEESDAGAGSFFSSATADAVSSVAVDDGLLNVDFNDVRSLLNNASTSCGSEALLSQLNNTAFQFPEVDRVRYKVDGSCALFSNWLQRECFEMLRDGRQIALPTNEQAEGSGCTPPTGDGLPDGRWFGYVDDSQSAELDFDLACWFTGTSAAAAASEDGEESPPPNDYYVRNQSDRARTLAVDPTARVAWLPNPGDPTTLAVLTYDSWLAEQPGRLFPPGVWLTIENGQITDVEEQFVP